MQYRIFRTVALALWPLFWSGWSLADGAKRIVVYTEDQILIAQEGDKVVHEFDVVTGKPGKETTEGLFHIGRKYEDYTSMTYDVPMPYSMFFSNDGKAIHATPWATVRSYLHAYITESVGSSGRVGLNEDDARTLFKWAPIGTPVQIIELMPEE